MKFLRLLPHARFGDLAPGARFQWGRWFEGQLKPVSPVFTRMKGNRYKDPRGRTWTTGARVAVEEVE